MSAEESKPETPTPSNEKPSSSLSLRNTIGATRQFLCRTVSTARAHSPLSDDKLEAADEAVSSAVHTGFQAVKHIAVYGHPTVILSVAGLAGALPSFPFGARAIVRNAGLAVTLAAVMIYPDHLRAYASSRKE